MACCSLFSCFLFCPNAIDMLLREELDLKKLNKHEVVKVFVMVQVLMIILSIIAARVAFGTKLTERLPLSAPALGHFVLVLLAVFPVYFLDVYIASGYQALEQQITGQPPDVPESVQEILDMASLVPFGLALLAVAVAPAICEEIIFRGIIGRGLIARYGFVGGVAFTSALFAAVHLAPMQVIGLIPVAIMLHVIYLSTRSFWMPMLLHLLNNTIALLMV